ncbi:hypothetical protein CHCC14814_4017 [Bacillus paralicheniformis]|nr:hypothetical protein CHCC14814_4017 [Bacillus paralicheniformis]
MLSGELKKRGFSDVETHFPDFEVTIDRMFLSSGIDLLISYVTVTPVLYKRIHIDK